MVGCYTNQSWFNSHNVQWMKLQPNRESRIGNRRYPVQLLSVLPFFASRAGSPDVYLGTDSKWSSVQQVTLAWSYKEMSTEEKPSDIWSYFEQASTPNKFHCVICRAVITGNKSSSFNLKRHIKNKHPTVNLQRQANETQSVGSGAAKIANPGNQKALNSFFEVKKPLSAAEKKSIDEKVLKVFCNHALPFYLVEAEDFKELFTTLRPSYNLPSRKTLSNT